MKNTQSRYPPRSRRRPRPRNPCKIEEEDENEDEDEPKPWVFHTGSEGRAPVSRQLVDALSHGCAGKIEALSGRAYTVTDCLYSGTNTSAFGFIPRSVSANPKDCDSSP